MTQIENASFLYEAIETCAYFWEAGWGENHAGNLSYLLADEELELYRSMLTVKRTVPINFSTEGLIDRVFLVTRSGAYFRKIRQNPEKDFGIIRIKSDHLEVLWGFLDKSSPTSELSAHIQCHNSRLKKESKHRLVLHCHPTQTIAMTFAHSLNEKEFSETMWSLNSECVLVFPEGLGLLPWMVCGDGEIGLKTAEKMLKYRSVIWPHHGMFAAGTSFDETIGLIETIEKNAKVFMLNNGKLKQRITLEQIKELRRAFHV